MKCLLPYSDPSACENDAICRTNDSVTIGILIDTCMAHIDIGIFFHDPIQNLIFQ